jgi:hypothetical protein
MLDIRYNRSNLQQSPHRRVITIALVIAGLGMVGFFGLRAYRAYDRFQHDAPAGGVTDVAAIRGWMTLPYIARAYGVPEDWLFEALAIPKAGNTRLSVKQLVVKYDRDPQTTRQAIQQVLLREQRVSTPSGGTP